MAINTLTYLILTALIGFSRLRMRLDRILSWLMLALVVYVFINYSQNALENNKEIVSFLWSKTQLGEITVDFSPSPAANRLIIPLFFMSVMTILNNNIFRYEEKRSAFNSLIILNLITLSLLICAKNYVQLITAVFVSDILGYLILKNVDSSHRYVIYNFFADMCLFMILALVCGKMQSLELNSLLNYKKIGAHRDFVSLITLFAVFIKIGCFLFQSYLFDISAARFQRMNAVNLLFAPMSGIILLVKLQHLLLVSNLFEPFYIGMSCLTYITGQAYFIMKDNIKKKVVCLNMMFNSLLMLALKLNNFEWNTLFSYYVLTVFVLNQFFFKLYLYQNREEKVSKMLNADEQNKLPMQVLLLQIVIWTMVFLALINNLSDKILLALAVIIVWEISVVLNHIYKSPHSRRLDYLNKNPLRFLSFIINTIVLLGLGYLFNIYNLNHLLIAFVFLGSISIPYWEKWRSIYTQDLLQKEDISKSLLGYILVAPLKYISRMMWLVVDLVFSEKIITALFASASQIGVSCFFKVNKKNTLAGIFFILLGIAVFILSFYRNNLP